jgi:hypothetical protein
MNTSRGRVLTWWLLLVLTVLTTVPVVGVGAFGEGSFAGLALLPGAFGAASIVTGLQVLAIVHADHEAAVASRGAAPTGP